MWYYVKNGQQQGPFDETPFQELIAKGEVTPGTYVWKEGLANWAPLADVRNGLANADTCQVCNKAVGADNLIELNGVRVCAVCKPVALQTMREGVTLGGDTVWSEGKKMVTRDGARFPARCIKCNTPTSGEPIESKLLWNSPWLLLIIFVPYVGLIGLIIVSILTRKRALVHLHVCPTHRQHRLYAIIGSFGGIFAGFALIIAAAVYNLNWLILAGILSILGAIIVGMRWGRYTRTTRITPEKTVWLRGAGKEFLASLPPWNGT